MLFRARQFEFVFRAGAGHGRVNVTQIRFPMEENFSMRMPPWRTRWNSLPKARNSGHRRRIHAARRGPVSEAEELRRVIPVIEKLANQTKVALSIDTMKPAVAHAALAPGRASSMMSPPGAARMRCEVVANFSAGYIVMHARVRR